MRHTRRSSLALAIGLAALTSVAGCQREGARDLPEWTPADHQQPSEPDPERTPGQSVDASPETVARAAAALWGSSCASCHGVEGRGDGPEVPGGAEMPDMTSAEFQDSRTDPDLARTIRMGQGLMPAFGTQLNERGITALVGHVRTLRAGAAE